MLFNAEIVWLELFLFSYVYSCQSIKFSVDNFSTGTVTLLSKYKGLKPITVVVAFACANPSTILFNTQHS